MAWDFSIYGNNKALFEKNLIEHLYSKWELKTMTKNALIKNYEEFGLTIAFFNELTKHLCLELDLYVNDVFNLFEFDEFFARRSKKGNQGMHSLFLYWNKEINTTKIEMDDCCVFMNKEELIELVYWLEICCTILAEEPVYLYEPINDQILLKEAKKYCESVKEYDEMKAFSYYLEMHQYFRENIEKMNYDFFCWYNSF